MIIDSSAMIAILRDEPEGPSCIQAIRDASARAISAPNLYETAIVTDGSGDPVLSRRLDDLVREAEIKVEPFTEEQARIARDAYRDFGKGSGHPAKLNFGDCFAYALAHATGETLLYKGNDFSQTGIRSALASDEPE